MAAAKEYFDFIGSVKDRIRSAQYEALKAINKELVGLYWDIGRMISEKQKELGWGKAVDEKIAKDLKLVKYRKFVFPIRELLLIL